MIEKVYVTKYALTDSVRVCKVLEMDTSSRGSDVLVEVEWPGALNGKLRLRLGRDAHALIGDAEYAFQAMRESEIRAAKRKLEKLEAMKFEVKE